MHDTLLSLSPKGHEIKVEIDPDRLRPIDADLQVPDTTIFPTHWLETGNGFNTTMSDLLNYYDNVCHKKVRCFYSIRATKVMKEDTSWWKGTRFKGHKWRQKVVVRLEKNVKILLERLEQEAFDKVHWLWGTKPKRLRK